MKLNTFLSRVDCTLLDANAMPEDFKNMSRDACEWKCRAVCVPMGFGSLCRNEILGWSEANAMHPHRVKLCVVVDFPDGNLDISSRKHLVEYAITDANVYADEVDIVMPIGRFLAGDYWRVPILDGLVPGYVSKDLSEVVRASYGMKVKIIVETGYLTDDQILQSAVLVQVSGAFCWKTSTGRDPKVAIPEKARHVRMVREAFPNLKIKAAGGIRTQEDVLMLHDAGADIFGISWKALKDIAQNWE